MTLPPKPPKKPKALAVGDIVDGRYEVIRQIGEGGMAIVYAVRHRALDVVQALKLIRPDVLLNKPQLLEAFLTEAKLTASLSDHPSVVHVFDAGFDEDLDQPYMVMSLMKGETLDAFMFDQQLEGRRWLLWQEARPLLRDIASALEAAHAEGIIHRDVKPTNIFIVEGEGGKHRAKLMDFGIAKVLGPQLRTATAIGTPAYSAPEQLGRDIREMAASAYGITIAVDVSPQTDVWAYAIVAYLMLSGIGPSKLWGADSTAGIAAVSAFRPRPPLFEHHPYVAHLLPPTFEALLYRGLHHNAAKRWEGPLAFWEALCAIMDDFEQTRPDDEDVADVFVGHIGMPAAVPAAVDSATGTSPTRVTVATDVLAAATRPLPLEKAAIRVDGQTNTDPMAQTELLSAAPPPAADADDDVPASKSARTSSRAMLVGAAVVAAVTAAATAGMMAFGQGGPESAQAAGSAAAPAATGSTRLPSPPTASARATSASSRPLSSGTPISQPNTLAPARRRPAQRPPDVSPKPTPEPFEEMDF